jgi:hypothetical protein
MFRSVALVVAGVLLAFAAACGKVEGGGDDGDGDGDGDGADHRDGGGDGDSGIGPVDDCEPGEPIACDGAELRVCNAAGDGEERVTCALRCDPDGPACHDIIDPSNGLAAALDLAESAPDLVVDGGGTIFFDTVNDVAGTTATINGQTFETTVIAGAGTAPDVLVVPVASLRVVAGTIFSVVGERAVAFVSWGDVRIQGEMRALAGRSESVEEDCWGRASGEVGTDEDVPGPGGGSFATFGGNGGSVTGIGTAGTGKAAGDLVGNETLVPLRGGCPGGFDGFGGPGIGGGALQIASRTLITIPGALGANGGGGCVSSGGGSGGGLLLEAPMVTVAGGVFANGGGGGCGGFSCAESATMSTTPAAGDDVCTVATGGDGAAGDVEATDGTDDPNNAGQADRAGGGGGGLGRIRVNTLDGTVAGASTFSPAPSLGEVAGR